MSINIDIDAQEPEPELEQETEFDPRVDRLAELLAWQESNKKDPRTKELTNLKKELAAEAAKFSPGETVTLEGQHNRVFYGEASQVRTIVDMDKVLDMLDPTVLKSCINVPLSVIDDYLTPIQKAEVIATERAGSRSMKVLPKPKDE
jgi:hypothetical protein